MPTTVGPSKLIASLTVKGLLLAAGSTSREIRIQHYYMRPVAGVATTKAALHAAFLAGPYAAYLAAFNVGWTAGSTNIRFLDDALDPTVTQTLAGVGAIATDRLPSYNAVFMRQNTGVRGKSFRGSKHFAAGNEADTTGDILVGAGLARWQAVQTAVLGTIADANGIVWTPVVVSFKGSSLKVNPCTVVWNAVTEVVLDLTLGTMKKRKVRTVV